MQDQADSGSGIEQGTDCLTVRVSGVDVLCSASVDHLERKFRRTVRDHVPARLRGEDGIQVDATLEHHADTQAPDQGHPLGLQTDRDHQSDEQYVQLEVPAPVATDATLVKVPTEGWKRVLDGETHIERDLVTIMAGDLASGTFEGWHRTGFDDHETAVFPADHDHVRRQRQCDPDSVEPVDNQLAAAIDEMT